MGSGEIMTTSTGVRSDMFVEETATGQVGILRETWWDAEDEGWVGAVKWLAGKLVSERRSRGWSKFTEEGVSWPCFLPNFERWSRVDCDRLRPFWAYRERPLEPRPGKGCLWVWGLQEEREAEPPQQPVAPTRIAPLVEPDFVERVLLGGQEGGRCS